MLTVTVYPDAEALASVDEDDEPNGGVEFTDVDFVSFVNNGTYGPPALIAPNPKTPERGPRARLGQKVLYINTNLVPAFEIVRTAD